MLCVFGSQLLVFVLHRVHLLVSTFLTVICVHTSVSQSVRQSRWTTSVYVKWLVYDVPHSFLSFKYGRVVKAVTFESVWSRLNSRATHLLCTVPAKLPPTATGQLFSLFCFFFSFFLQKPSSVLHKQVFWRFLQSGGTLKRSALMGRKHLQADSWGL